MVYCKKCGAGMPDHSRFCSNCGQVLSGQKSMPSVQTGGGASPAATGKSVASAWIAASISAILVGVVCVFVFAAGGSGDAGRKESAAPSSTTESEQQSLKFSAETYELEVKQEMDMNPYLIYSGMEADEIEWSSDSDQAVVGSNGRVVIEEYGVNCRLTAKSRKRQEVMSICTLRTRTKGEDLAYHVEKLNGKHKETETDDEGVVKVSTDDKDNLYIKVDEEKVKPAKRNSKYSWDRKLFYRLEDVQENNDKDGQINSYIIEKKQFTNAENGHEMEYEIYHNPDTDKIHKIVSIEHQKKTLAMTEYYYTDKGKVNFIYCYKDVNYVPSYAQLDKKGERYMFHKNTMINWRIVDGKGERNYCYGKSQKKALQGHRGIKEYGKCSTSRKKAYDEKEKLMLNRAYNTWKKVTEYEGVSPIRGYVSNAEGQGLPDTKVSLLSEDYDCEVFSGTSDKDGFYEILVPARKGNYEIAFSKDDYIEEKLYHVKTDTDRIGIYQEMVCLAETDDSMYECKLSFYDALKRSDTGQGMQELNNLKVVIRRGVNNYDGDIVAEEEVDSFGLMIELESGMYTIQMRKKGYADSYSSLFVSAESERDREIYATPKLGKDELRIVLTWDETPRDLDSHLFVPSGDSGKDDHHICYYHMADRSGDTALDVDDTDGYGPETTSIYHMKKGQYKFYVADFTNCSQHQETSYEMSDSSAVVRVYGKNGLIQAFYVPVNHSGVIWEVFEIRDGAVVPIQRYYDSVGNKTWWSSKK